ncbi:ABC transporter ATP-binding protein [Serinibacter salmoneus]|uniref:ABC-2 type transport system ATP-binding protein n=1 Tax=Serinibacter salmoneus TaxID=556530 RepID=A0A2A9D044_9MICO|nr:ABC transporter ATP-binding protein [Serinibacter salmoneus]PFG19220.1 ABC-2 type transport system ATP-binding protein [Serinibacter salmoneus]
MTTTDPTTDHARGLAVETRGLTQTFGRTTALNGVDLTVRPGTITGLIGRNGAGKSTLVSLIAGLRRPSAGEVLVDGEPIFENPRGMAGTQLIRESGDAFDDEKVRTTLRWYADLRPNWDGDLAGRLVDAFELDVTKKAGKLSRGQRSTLGAIIGLASRAPLTIFDETYLGMDATNRQMFYDAILADYAAHPRTIILSSHLIGEVEQMFEDVIVLDSGRVRMAGTADDIRTRGLTLVGRTPAVEELAAGRTVLSRTTLGPTAQVTVFLTEGDDVAHLTQQASEVGVAVEAPGLQDLFVHLTRTDGAGSSSTSGAEKETTR